MAEDAATITRDGGYRIYVMGELKMFAKGDVVTGYVARKALEDGAAEKPKPKRKVQAAPENKATRPASTKRKKAVTDE